MKATVFCKVVDKGMHSFYLNHEGKMYYLFSQKYRKGVHNYFSQGVLIDDAIKHSRANKDSAIIRTMGKVPMYIKYIEKEFSIEVLKRTLRKKQLYLGISRCA